jgi:hypothetical protein
MADVQLYAKNQTNNQYVLLDLFTEQPIKLTLAVSNIVDPLSANSIFSRTFRVPHTSKNGPYFKAVFNVNSTDFDASVKAPAYINDNGIFFSSGNIRLSSIFVNEETNNVEYEINYYGETSDFGSQIGGGFLSEVNLNSYNHNQTYTNITNSWGGGLFGGDIVYPLVEWGYTYDNGVPNHGTFSRYTGVVGNKGTFGPISSPPPTANVITQGMMKPSIRAKALWDKIFGETDYTYSSTFLNSAEFTNLYIISEDEAREEILADQTFAAAGSASQVNNSGGTYDVFFDTQLYDNANQYDPVTSVFTAASTSGDPYVFQYQLAFTGPLIPVLRSVGAFPQLVDADTGSLLASTGTPTIVSSGTPTYATGFFSVSLAAGQRVRMRIQYTSLNPPDADVPIIMFDQNWSLFDAPENVNVSTIMPSNIRKIDFMRSIINRFRLVFVPSKDISNHFEITPWKDWILQGQSLDWTSKLDGSKDMKITPLFYGQERLQVYKDQEDADFLNYNYQLDYKQTYGQLNRDSNNELIRGVRTIQDQFAPTPIFPMGNVDPSNPLYQMPFPHLAKDTNTERQPIQPKLRLVYYNGVKPVPDSNQWWLQSDFGGPIGQTVYPLMSEYSSWPVTTSTFDLAWENEPPLYDTETSGLSKARTNFDQFSVYWKTWYDVSFDPFSRIVEANFVLDWTDIINLKFNDYVYVKDAWYFVNKITDYISGSNTNCRVELVKLGNNIGLTLPIGVEVGNNPIELCYGRSKCEAYCCTYTNATYYIDRVAFVDATFIYTDFYGSIPAEPGFYSDGDLILQVGPSGSVIGTAVNDCDCLVESFPFTVCVGEALCNTCCCDSGTTTIYGVNADFFANLNWYSDSLLTVPAADGWYKLSVGTSPTQSIFVSEGEVQFVSLCETSTGCSDDGCTSYSLFSAAGGGVTFTPCGDDLPVGTFVPAGVRTSICAVTGSVEVASGTVSITAQPSFIPVCDCGETPVYNPYEFTFAETLCGVCCDGTPITLWLEDPETPATATILYANNIGTTRAGAGYYKYGTDVLIVDASGNVTAYSNCESCTCDYYYVAQNCNEELVQNFSYPTPLAIGTVVSSSSFVDQCWEIIDVATSGFPIDFVFESCAECAGSTPCECINYDIITGESGGAIQYIDCATQTVMYRDLAPLSGTQQCACADSVIVIAGTGVTITELGPCATPEGCNTYQLESPEGGSVDATLCGEELPVGVFVPAGEIVTICAVTGSVTVSSGDITIIDLGPCDSVVYYTIATEYLGTLESDPCALICETGTIVNVYSLNTSLATSTQIFSNISGTLPATAGYYRDPEGTVYEVDDMGFVSVFDSGSCPACIPAFRVLFGNQNGISALNSDTGAELIDISNLVPNNIYVDNISDKIISVNTMQRYNFDGTIDASFNNTNIANNEIVSATKIGSNYYFAGRFTTSKGNTVNRIAAVDNSGNYVNMTSRGTGFTSPSAMGLTSHNGSLYVWKIGSGGTKPVYNGVTCEGVVQMDTNGLITAQFNIGTLGLEQGIVPVFDSAGNMYVSTAAGSPVLYKFSPVGGLPVASVNLYAGVQSTVPRGIAIDSLNRIYLSGMTFIRLGTSPGNTSKYIVRLNTSLVYDSTFTVSVDRATERIYLEDDSTMYAVRFQADSTYAVNKINLTTQTVDTAFVSPAVVSAGVQRPLDGYTIV